MRSFVPLGSFLGGSFLGFAAFAGCTTETSEPPPDSGVFQGGDGGPPSCAACLERPCLGAWAICLTDDACQAIHACASHGDASACVSCADAPDATAGDAGADPRALHRAFAGCNAAHVETCAPRCTNASSVPTCGGDAGVDACTACIDGACGNAERACGVGTECAAFLACAYDAADATSAEDCARLHATGKAAAVELATCTHVECTQPCGL